MAIGIDVFARLHDRQLRRESERLHDDLRRDYERLGQDTGRLFGDSFGRSATPAIRRAHERAAEAAAVAAMREATVRTERQRSEAATRTAARTEAQLSDARRNTVRDTEAESRLERTLEGQRTAAARSTERLARAELQHTRALNAQRDAERRLGAGNNRGTPGGGRGGGGRGLLVAAAVPAAALAVDLLPALYLVPSAVAAAGAAIGSLAMAFDGFGDSMKNIGDPEKFAVALQSLSPNARQAALSIKGLMPALHDLKTATQDSFFAGMGEELQALTTTYMPAVRELTAGTAGAFGDIVKNMSTQLMTPTTLSAMDTTFKNIVGSFKELSTAAAPFTQAMGDIMAVGSGVFKDLSGELANAAREFGTFISEARQTGELQQWIENAVEDAKMFGKMLWDVGRAFAALAPVSREILSVIADALEVIGGLLREHPSLVWAAVGAWAAFKALGIATSISTIALALGGAGGLNAGLAAIPALAGAATRALGPLAVIAGSIAGGNAAANAISGEDRPWYWAIQQGFTAPGRIWDHIFGDDPAPDNGPLSPSQIAIDRINNMPYVPGLTPNAPTPTPTSPGFLGSSVGGLTATGPSWQARSPFASNDSGGGSGSDADRYAGLDINSFMPPLPSGMSQGDMYALAQGASGRTTYAAASDMVHGLADCSGSLSDLYEVLTKGVSSPERMFTTTNFASDAEAAKLGFLPGYRPGAFNVGVNPYPGSSGHMAATLPNGVNFEGGGATGGGAQYGGNAAGALDPQFQKHYYLPVGSGDGGQDVQRAAYDLAKARLEQAASDRDPKASSLDRADAAQRVLEAGQDYDKALQKLAEVQQGTFGKLKDSANGMADGMQQIGAKLDDDFGISKGLPGIIENLTKMLANLAMAPVIGALSGVTASYGTAGPGSGILGAFAPRQNAFGQQMPNVLGQYAPQQGTTPGGYSPIPGAPVTPLPGGVPAAPGLNTPGTPGTPAYAPLSGPQLTNPGLTTPTPLGPMAGSPGAGYPLPWNPALPNSVRGNTPSMGIPSAQGLPASEGIGLSGGGLLGAAGSAISSAAGLAGGMFTGGGGGAAASAAAQIGIDLMNRGISFGAQSAGILTQGVLDTFLPVESELASPMSGWFGRILGGVAGVRPVANNLAGALGQSQESMGDKPLSPDQIANNSNADNSVSNSHNSVTNNNTFSGGTPDENAEAIGKLTQRSYAMPGSR